MKSKKKKSKKVSFAELFVGSPSWWHCDLGLKRVVSLFGEEKEEE